MAPTTATALVTRGGKLSKETIPVPTPGEHQVLVKVSYVAQNPTDVQSLDANAFGDDAVLGCDFVGTVEMTGDKVSRIKAGTVIAGLIWGGEIKGLGGYSEYTLADERICFPLPEGISLEQSSTVPLAACTALLALFSKNCLNVPQESGQTVLIWGGSSSVGLYAIQIAKYYGLNVVTTCSPRHHDLVKSLGATRAFDYRDANVVESIKAATNSSLEYVFDTIGNESSSVIASQAISEQGGGLCTVRPGKTFTENVTKQTKVTDVLVWTAFLKEHKYKDFYWPPHKEDHKLSVKFFEELPKLLSSGVIKPNTPKLFEGLDFVPKGFQEYRDGFISNYKIVYKV
ncbi:Alcohol dehydrogenase GroES-like domain protein [Aspergillus sclerotialis]|uniref:Alcohol dehydrogenase GroES-like domain protein n=1 Tax=Aspergillus sclerotialis TaxID=2070753 RepID=A0A3A2ZVH4_9EURO|nr:Alcohol dehydrogenase GroES-like domain protein [Aspergillus sclerotialis]